jgi:uncharacterized membrane protein
MFEEFYPEIITFLIAMSPVLELRGAIPVALVYGLSLPTAFFWAVLGNVISITFALLFLDPVSKFLMKNFEFFDRFFTKLFEKTRKEHNHKFEKWGALALIAFVAIPLPFTGGWTGALAAFVFGIPFQKAFPLIVFGILIAGIIMSAVSAGAIKVI